GRARRPCDGDVSLFERLAQDLQYSAIELGHLVQEENAVVRKRDLARPRNGAAADQGHVRNRVMRRAKWTPDEQPRSGGKQASHGVDRGALERFIEGERRQDAAQAPREHGLSGARRTAQQQVVTAGGGNLERAPREKL